MEIVPLEPVDGVHVTTLHALGAAMPDAFVPNSVGTRFEL